MIQTLFDYPDITLRGIGKLMIPSKQLSAIAVVASLCLGACTSSGGASRANVPSIASDGESADAVGAAAIGDTINLPAGNPTGAQSADVIAEYFAASNRRCRQVLPRGGQAVRIACEQKNGSWKWVRALTTSEVPQPLPALVTVGATEPTYTDITVVESSYTENLQTLDANTFSGDVATLSGTASHPDNASVQAQRVDVEPGETLWKFAQRTTGSGAHWQAIAELNGIDDARTVTSSMSLLLPPHLAIGQ